MLLYCCFFWILRNKLNRIELLQSEKDFKADLLQKFKVTFTTASGTHILATTSHEL